MFKQHSVLLWTAKTVTVLTDFQQRPKGASTALRVGCHG